jgi:signal recognition particle subunit SRP68
MVDLPSVTLEIFNVVKSSHAQHGLRHGDYTRYRQYCSRRLRRIRKTLGMQHGKGRFVRRALEPHMVKDAKALTMPLYAAERAWSYAMAIKRENTADESRPRFHLLSRLNKAAKWSEALYSLCAVRGDERTALEAEAYSGFMFGNMHLEREQWASAITHLKKTRTICTELCRVSMSDQVHLYKTVAEEVEPSIRFCAYNLRRLGVGSGEEEEGEANGEAGMMNLLDGDSPGGSDILRSKLEVVLNESRARQAESFSELEVLGELVPIKSEKVRIAILSSQQKILEIQAASMGADGLMEKYDGLFVAFNDALEGVRADLRAATKEQSARSGVSEASLLKLQASLTWQKLDHTVIRTMHLVEQFKRTLSGVERPAGSNGSGKRATPEDIVRLYDSAISSLNDMALLDGYREETSLMEQLVARQAAAKACRCYYLAESYGSATRYPEAQALYRRAADLMVEAAGLLQDAGYKRDSSELHSLANLEMLIDGAKARAHAQAFVKILSGGAVVAETGETLGTLEIDAAGDAASGAGDRPLIDSLGVFERPRPEHLVPFPPEFVTVPCKPVLFDIARNQVTPPDLSGRFKAKRSGWGAYLFGGH